MKLYYDVDREKVYSLEDVRSFYEEYEDKNEVTFEQYLNNCMTANNGSLDVYEVRYFDDIASLKSYVRQLEQWEMVWTEDGVYYIDTTAQELYTVKIDENRINERISTAIDDIFLDCQEEIGITSGDINPFDYEEITELVAKLTEVTARVLKYQNRK